MQSDSTDVFITSLQKYLSANQFSTGTSQKLWQAVAEEADLPIGDWMQQWTYSGGFPLVSASMQGNKVTLSQVSRLWKKAKTRLCCWLIVVKRGSWLTQASLSVSSSVAVGACPISNTDNLVV